MCLRSFDIPTSVFSRYQDQWVNHFPTAWRIGVLVSNNPLPPQSENKQHPLSNVHRSPKGDQGTKRCQCCCACPASARPVNWAGEACGHVSVERRWLPAQAFTDAHCYLVMLVVPFLSPLSSCVFCSTCLQPARGSANSC